MKYTFLKKAASTLLAGLVVATPLGASLGAQKAHALFGVGDTTFDVGLNNPFRIGKELVGFGKQVATAASSAATSISANSLVVKEYGLDSIAYLAAQTAMHSIVQSTINWINGGFNGSPAFVTDLKTNLRQVADAQAQGFLTQVINENAIHSPFIDQLITGVGASYYLYSSRDAIKERLRYTLAETSPNPRAFQAGDFKQGGWNAWFSSFQNPANNPYGAQMLASQLLAGQIESQVTQRVTELGWGSGFQSWRGDCISTASGPTDATSLSDADKCTAYEVKTPGAMIIAASEKAGFVGIDQLVSADEMNEIVGALFGQLMNKMLGGGGLSGLSQPSSGGGSSPLTQATGGGGGGAANITATFKGIITKQLGQLDQYAGAWNKILAAAQSSLAACGDVDGTAQTTIDQATKEIAKSAESKVLLTNILADFAKAGEATGSEQSNLLLSVSDRYQSASRDTIPTASDIQDVLGQAEDSGEDGVPMTLYTKFNLLATKGCVLPTQTGA